jgi:hypothetical protein
LLLQPEAKPRKGSPFPIRRLFADENSKLLRSPAWCAPAWHQVESCHLPARRMDARRHQDDEGEPGDGVSHGVVSVCVCVTSCMFMGRIGCALQTKAIQGDAAIPGTIVLATVRHRVVALRTHTQPAAGADEREY